MEKGVLTHGTIESNVFLNGSGIYSVLYELEIDILGGMIGDMIIEGNKVYNKLNGNKFHKELTYSEKKALDSIRNLKEFVKNTYM